MSTLKVDTIKSDTTPTVTISDGLSVTGVTTFVSNERLVIIQNGGTSGQPEIAFRNAADSGDAYGNIDGATLDLRTGGTSRLHITSAGLVGINTTPSTAQLVVKNSNDSSLNSIDVYNDNGNQSTSISQDSSGAGSFLQKDNSGTVKTFIKSYGDSYFTGGGVIIGNTAPVFSSPTPSLTIEKSDNATGPLFQMYNAVASQSGATCEIRVHQNYRDANRIIFGRENNNNWQSGASGAASYMGFWTNSAGTMAERMRIKSNGYIGIGEDSPTTLLNLKGTAGGGATGLKIVNTADEYTGAIFDANRTTAGNALGLLAGRWNSNDVCAIYLSAGADTTNKDDGRLYLQTRPSGGSIQNRLQLTEDGVWYGSLYNTNTNAGLSANIFVFSNDSMGRASSSGKYKKNIETIQDSYADKILTMRPTWYQQDETTVNIQEDQGDDWGYWGFIAEEVAAIDPRLVTWKVANYTTDPNDSTKSIRTPLSEPEPDNVAYDRFVPHLVNLLKRQSVEIETLKTKVAALESA